ncbi:MAG: hypothetical protein LBJ38_02460 [Oscillospiraceae bacterium]|jgi:hypothetical protein|nr:hypothetical protein [Oscillospiraceae bacterium]
MTFAKRSLIFLLFCCRVFGICFTCSFAETRTLVGDEPGVKFVNLDPIPTEDSSFWGSHPYEIKDLNKQSTIVVNASGVEELQITLVNGSGMSASRGLDAEGKQTLLLGNLDPKAPAYKIYLWREKGLLLCRDPDTGKVCVCVFDTDTSWFHFADLDTLPWVKSGGSQEWDFNDTELGNTLLNYPVNVCISRNKFDFCFIPHYTMQQPQKINAPQPHSSNGYEMVLRFSIPQGTTVIKVILAALPTFFMQTGEEKPWRTNWLAVKEVRVEGNELNVDNYNVITAEDDAIKQIQLASKKPETRKAKKPKTEKPPKQTPNPKTNKSSEGGTKEKKGKGKKKKVPKLELEPESEPQPKKKRKRKQKIVPLSTPATTEENLADKRIQAHEEITAVSYLPNSRGIPSKLASSNAGKSSANRTSVLGAMGEAATNSLALEVEQTKVEQAEEIHKSQPQETKQEEAQPPEEPKKEKKRKSQKHPNQTTKQQQESKKHKKPNQVTKANQDKVAFLKTRSHRKKTLPTSDKWPGRIYISVTAVTIFWCTAGTRFRGLAAKIFSKIFHRKH